MTAVREVVMVFASEGSIAASETSGGGGCLNLQIPIPNSKQMPITKHQTTARRPERFLDPGARDFFGIWILAFGFFSAFLS